MGDIKTELIATMVGGVAGGQAAASITGGETQKSLIRQTMTQERLASTERSIARTKKFENVLASQEAKAAASGLSTAGGSIKALAVDSFDKFNLDEQADALNLSFKENVLEAQIKKASMQELTGILDTFGTVASELGSGTVTSELGSGRVGA